VIINSANLNRRLLRFGIICNGKALENWQVECLDHILKTGCARLALVITGNSFMAMPQTGIYKNLLYDLYFNRLHKPSALDPVEIDAVLQGSTRLYCHNTEPDGLSINFSDDNIRDIRNYDLDFILNFSSMGITGDILKAIKYGIWSFCHSGIGNTRQFPPCFWEILAGDNLTVAVLEKSTGQADTAIVLKHGVFKAYKAPLADNINSIYHESARWPAQVCIDIMNGRAGYIHGNPAKRKVPRAVIPDNFQVSLFVVRALINYFKHLVNKYVIHEDWNIGIIYKPIHTFLTSNTTPEVHWFAHPKNRFRADPFGVMKDGELHVIYEDYDYRRMKGSISTIKLSPEASSGPVTIINQAVHMSYPFILEFGGEVYCIPETSRAREICIYKALDFPNRWAKVSTMIENFEGVDPTIFQYNSLWWLFCTNKDYGSILNLYIWYSRDLLGPWQPHKLNPVKTDVRSARPAGTPFSYNGELYRPSQDCSGTYGGKIIINRIKKLTTTDFEEEPIKAIEPCRNCIYHDGIHTLSAIGDITLVDGKRRTIDLLILRNTLVSYSIKFINKYVLNVRGHYKVSDRRIG
jgi:hypothetical protein